MAAQARLLKARNEPCRKPRFMRGPRLICLSSPLFLHVPALFVDFTFSSPFLLPLKLGGVTGNGGTAKGQDDPPYQFTAYRLDDPPYTLTAKRLDDPTYNLTAK